jgi:hypothetical protein
MPQHLGDDVYRHPLLDGEGRGGMPQVVEADLRGQACLLKKPSQGMYHCVAAADFATGVWENEARIRPGGSGHPLLKLAGAVGFEGLGGAGPDADPALLAGLGGGDTRPSSGVSRAADGNCGLVRIRQVYVLPAQGGEFALAHPRAQRHHDQGLVPRPFRGRDQA